MKTHYIETIPVFENEKDDNYVQVWVKRTKMFTIVDKSPYSDRYSYYRVYRWRLNMI